MPAKINFPRPVAVMAWATLGSSNALTDVRSFIGTPGSASTSSGKVGSPSRDSANTWQRHGSPASSEERKRAFSCSRS